MNELNINNVFNNTGLIYGKNQASFPRNLTVENDKVINKINNNPEGQ